MRKANETGRRHHWGDAIVLLIYRQGLLLMTTATRTDEGACGAMQCPKHIEAASRRAAVSGAFKFQVVRTFLVAETAEFFLALSLFPPAIQLQCSARLFGTALVGRLEIFRTGTSFAVLNL